MVTLCNENKIREKLGYQADEPIQTGKTGVALTLEHDAYAIVHCKKNGTALTQVYTGAPTATQFLFTRPRTITLGAASITSDIWDIRDGITHPTDILTNVILEAEDEIYALLGHVYDITGFGNVASSTNSPTMEKLVYTYARWILADKKWAAQFPGEQSPAAQAKKDFYEKIDAIVKGSMNVLSSTNTLIARKTEQETVTIVAAATPKDNMTLLDSSSVMDHLDRTLLITIATSGSSCSGYVQINATDFNNDDISIREFFSSFTGIREIKGQIKTITGFHAGTLTGGTSPTIKLESIKYTGRFSGGSRS